MKRDSIFNELVRWSGRPKEITTPPLHRAAALVCLVTSAIATTSAIVVSTVLERRPSELLGFAAWMSILAVAFYYGPRWWRSELEFTITDLHVVMRRGRLRRSIELKSISYARIHWNPKATNIGDLELVRAVPTGALRRRLSIVLPGLIAPDRVWAIMRGVTPPAPAGDGHRLIAQRLDEGERVLWSGHPSVGWRKWLPRGLRAQLSVAGGIALASFSCFTAAHAVDALRKVVQGGLKPESLSFVALVISLSLTIVLLMTAGAGMIYAATVRPGRLEAHTRYWITDRRVLIQRGDEELHLDRSRIVDIIDAPGSGGLHDVFLVLDGPRARALAASGAFGEADATGLLPVLHRLADVDAIHRIFRSGEVG
jgi:hypothetical protein